MYSEVRDSVQDEEEEEGADGEEDLTVLGYWSNPEAEVGNLTLCVEYTHETYQSYIYPLLYGKFWFKSTYMSFL